MFAPPSFINVPAAPFVARFATNSLSQPTHRIFTLVGIPGTVRCRPCGPGTEILDSVTSMTSNSSLMDEFYFGPFSSTVQIKRMRGVRNRQLGTLLE